MNQPSDILFERGQQYNKGGFPGDHVDNFRLAYDLRALFRETAEMKGVSPDEMHAVEMILVKVARIATGAYVADNYNDIMGYARLAQLSAEARNGRAS